jgi:hypothetical protein
VILRYYVYFVSLFTTISTLAQVKTRKLDELVNNKESAWTFVKGWADSANNKVEILEVDSVEGANALVQTQVSTRSPMGAIIYHSGGILIDNGWIRILGSGSKKLGRTLPEWNKGKTYQNYGESPKSLLIADDVIGGFFVLNGGGLGNDLGKVYYFSPDNLQYEPLDMTYTDFISFCFNGNLALFYKDYRWNNWKEDVSGLDGNRVYSFYPFLWTKEGQDINKNSKKSVPIVEQYFLEMDFRKQLGLTK